MCETVSGRIKVLSNKFISKVVAKSVCEFACVCKFVSAPMFAQWVHSPSYHVVYRCDFNLFNKVIINTRHSVSVCGKVCKFVF